MEKILIVDDNPMNIRVLGELLKKNYRVFIANNGEKALKSAKEIKPDIILLDVMMPEMDGYTACRKIKEVEELKEVPIIFITAKTKSDDIVEGFESGAQDYVVKPFKPQELLLRVKTHLELYKSKQLIKEYAREVERQNYELREAFEEIEKISKTDYLTGISNRRYMVIRLEEELSRIRRYTGTFSIAICDIDNFKAVNDNYGHDCGDYVLKGVSSVIESSLRNEDVASRWGGEEFMIMFPGTEIEGAYYAAEKLRKNISEHEFYCKNEKLDITVTIGIAEIKGKSEIDMCIRKADEALYIGKKQGKDVVVKEQA